MNLSIFQMNLLFIKKKKKKKKKKRERERKEKKNKEILIISSLPLFLFHIFKNYK